MFTRFVSILTILIIFKFSSTLAQPNNNFKLEIIFSQNQSVETLQEFLPSIRILESSKTGVIIELSARDFALIRGSKYNFRVISAPIPKYLEITNLKNTAPSNPVIQSIVNKVSTDSLGSYILKLQSFGTRYEYTPQQDSAGVYIYNKFVEWGLQAEFDTYAFGLTTIYDLDFVDENTGWLVGTSGMIVKTTNGGETWTAQTSGITSELYGVDFVNENIGFAVGQAGTILKTTNGGLTWSSQTSGTTSSLYDVNFINEQIGLVVGATGRILRTTNGGSNWTLITSGTTQTLRELQFVDTSNAWAVGTSGTIRRSTDGGSSWFAQTAPGGITRYLRAVSFIDNQNGWIVGDGKVILKTTDSGNNWIRKNAPAGVDSILRGVSFVNSQIGWAIDYVGVIIKTTDGGENWFTQYTHRGWRANLTNIKAKTESFIIAIGVYGNLYKSTNSGINWNKKTSSLPSQYIHISNNIVATIPGIVSPEKECIIVAHYDSYSSINPTVTAPGANDNATGTSAVMEAARLCKELQFENTVRFIAVSGEELGMFGSDHYAFKARDEGRNIIGVINGDMIGYPTTPDTARLVVGSYLVRNRLVDSSIVYNQRYGIGLTLVAIIDNTGASDYGPFALAGYDALDVAEATAEEIWGGADPYYHTPQDTYDKLKPSLIKKGAQLMLASLAELGKPIIYGNIAGKIYHDLNRDSLTINDSTLPNWVVKLYQNGTLIRRTTTDTEGNYYFQNLPINTYTVEESLYFNWNQSIPRTDHPNITFNTFGPNAGPRAYLLDLNLNNEYTSIDFANYSKEILQTYNYNSGWNLVSVPIKLENYAKQLIFPTSSSDAYTYSDSYFKVDTLQNGDGYWLKFPTSTSIQLLGQEIECDTLDVSEGWNLIGSITYPVPIENIVLLPPVTTLSGFYEYNNGYKLVNLIQPGKAYWIKSNSNGKIILCR